MTGMSLPHAVVYVFPAPRVPAPDQTVPELWCDPRIVDDPVALLCELVTTYGEERALALWMWAHTRLRCERKRLIRQLLFVCQQQGA